jgi:hypothetical protein
MPLSSQLSPRLVFNQYKQCWVSVNGRSLPPVAVHRRDDELGFVGSVEITYGSLTPFFRAVAPPRVSLSPYGLEYGATPSPQSLYPSTLGNAHYGSPVTINVPPPVHQGAPPSSSLCHLCTRVLSLTRQNWSQLLPWTILCSNWQTSCRMQLICLCWVRSRICWWAVRLHSHVDTSHGRPLSLNDSLPCWNGTQELCKTVPKADFPDETIRVFLSSLVVQSLSWSTVFLNQCLVVFGFLGLLCPDRKVMEPNTLRKLSTSCFLVHFG